ncbi:MAG: hypothetical protein IT422_03100 [Pirellulaceae bacterium]|nr:hypothetical protein [Pirellulaceae bacterium]
MADNTLSAPADKLSNSERAALASLESKIDAGIKAFFELGESLRLIRDERLYRASHSTFDAYCQDRWGFGRRHCNRLIEAALVYEKVGPMGPKPTGERQCRPLAQLLSEGDEVIAEVWAEVVETAPRTAKGEPKLTESHIAAVAAKRKPGTVKRAKANGPTALPKVSDMGESIIVRYAMTSRLADPIRVGCNAFNYMTPAEKSKFLAWAQAQASAPSNGER